MSDYKKRIAEQNLADQLDAMGAVLIEGPKYCGKTTMALQPETVHHPAGQYPEKQYCRSDRHTERGRDPLQNSPILGNCFPASGSRGEGYHGIAAV